MADLENISEFIFPGSTLGFLADLRADQGPTRAYQGPWSLAGGVKFLSAEGPERLLSGLGDLGFTIRAWSDGLGGCWAVRQPVGWKKWDDGLG